MVNMTASFPLGGRLFVLSVGLATRGASGPLWLALFIAVASGCGPAIGTVSGTVSVDGKPLANGVISYVPAEGAGEPATGNVSGGSYKVQMRAGKKFVQISAPVVTGKRKEYEGPGAPLVEITEESLPPHYNSQTELT